MTDEPISARDSGCTWLRRLSWSYLVALRASGQDPAPGAKRRMPETIRQLPPARPAAMAMRRKEVAGKDQDDAGKDDARAGRSRQSKSRRTKAKAKAEPEFVRKTDAEWRKILTKMQYMVTRQKATEPAFSGKYATGHFRGTFLCVCCDAEVFNAQNKFDSGTGWPSFDRPANARAIGREMDYGAFEPRVEVMCRRCGAHLGHIFDDGPTITGLRFCINSAAIKLRPPEGESASTDRRFEPECVKGQDESPVEVKHKVESQGQGGTASSDDRRNQRPEQKAKAAMLRPDSEKPSPDQGR